MPGGGTLYNTVGLRKFYLKVDIDAFGASWLLVVGGFQEAAARES